MLLTLGLGATALSYLKKYWHITVPVVIMLLVLIGFGIQRACSKPPKIDEKTVRKAQEAIAKQDREEMQRVLVQSKVEEKRIDDSLTVANQEKVAAINEAKKEVSQMSNEQLAAELERLARGGQ